MTKIVENKNIVKCPINMVDKQSTKIITDNNKYNMYINALPTIIRHIVYKNELNPREIYNEYRKNNKQYIIEKYTNLYKDQ